MSTKVKAPWTTEEVRALKLWQKRGDVHPFTCGGDNNGLRCGAVLSPARDGFVCPDRCGYTQDWCYGFMLRSAKQPVTKRDSPNFAAWCRAQWEE